MKKFIPFCWMILCTTSLLAQTGSKGGIQFFKGSWSELLDAARQKDKMIFIDVYTDWCGPCKYMERSIFTQQQVAGQYNALFLNYKLNAEKGEGPALARKFGVNAYPTFLFLNSSGYLVHKAVGEEEKEAFIRLATSATQENANKNNLGNLEKTFNEGNRSPQFLHTYLDRLTQMGLDNSEVLDTYFKAIPYPLLEKDSTLSYLAQHITGTRTAALMYFIRHYDTWSNTSKAGMTNLLFERLIRNGAGLALKEKRFMEYNELAAFGNRLHDLNERQKEFLNRLDLMYGVATRDYAQLKKAGYLLATKPFSIPVDTIRTEDVRRYRQIMQPFLSGEKDSTKMPGFQEEKQYVINIYSRDISERLYVAAQAFAQLPSSEVQALDDALAWARRCYELRPEANVFADLIRELEDKKAHPRDDAPDPKGSW